MENKLENVGGEQNIPENYRTGSVLPNQVIAEIRGAKVLFLSVTEFDEITGVLIAIQDTLGLSDDGFEVVALDRAFDLELKENCLSIICMGDTPLSEMFEVVVARLDELDIEQELVRSLTREGWAMLTVLVGNGFYNKYELLSANNFTESEADITLSQWRNEEFLSKALGKAFVTDDKQACEKSKSTESYYLPPVSESF
jgi:hypothetical protein